MSQVFITGISGFLGQHLARGFLAAGWTVAGSVGHAASLGRVPAEVTQALILPLGETPDPAAFDGVDAIVHGAHDMRAGRGSDTVRGTVALAEAAASVSYQLYISSHSAATSAPSEYARTKRHLDGWFLEKGFGVVRPGLVIGSGGLFGRMAALVKRSPFVPLIDGGRALVPLIALDDLVAAVIQLANERRGGAVNLFLPGRVTLAELLRTIAREGGRRRLYVPVPSAPLIGILEAARVAGIPSPISRDNVEGLAALGGDLPESDISRLVPAPLSVASAVRVALKEGRDGPP